MRKALLTNLLFIVVFSPTGRYAKEGYYHCVFVRGLSEPRPGAWARRIVKWRGPYGAFVGDGRQVFARRQAVVCVRIPGRVPPRPGLEDRHGVFGGTPPCDSGPCRGAIEVACSPSWEIQPDVASGQDGRLLVVYAHDKARGDRRVEARLVHVRQSSSAHLPRKAATSNAGPAPETTAAEGILGPRRAKRSTTHAASSPFPVRGELR